MRKCSTNFVDIEFDTSKIVNFERQISIFDPLFAYKFKKIVHSYIQL